MQGAKPRLRSSPPDASLPGHQTKSAAVQPLSTHAAEGACREAHPPATPAEVPSHGSPADAADEAPALHDEAGVSGSTPPQPTSGGDRMALYTRASVRTSDHKRGPKSSQGSSEKPAKVAHVAVTALGQAGDLLPADPQAGHDRTAGGAALLGDDPPQVHITANLARVPPAEGRPAAICEGQPESKPGQLASVAVSVAAAGNPIPGAATPNPAASMSHAVPSEVGQASRSGDCLQAAADPASDGPGPGNTNAVKDKQEAAAQVSFLPDCPKAAANPALHGPGSSNGGTAKASQERGGHASPSSDSPEAAANPALHGPGSSNGGSAKATQETGCPAATGAKPSVAAADPVSPGSGAVKDGVAKTTPEIPRVAADPASCCSGFNNASTANTTPEPAGQPSPLPKPLETAEDPASHDSGPAKAGSAKAAASKKKRRRSSGRFQDTQTDYVAIPASAKRQKPQVLTRRQEEVANRQRQGAQLHYETLQYFGTQSAVAFEVPHNLMVNRGLFEPCKMHPKVAYRKHNYPCSHVHPLL